MLLIFTLFSGCMNTQHLKDLIIVEGMGIDSEKDGVKVYVQTLNVAINSTSESLEGNMTIVTDRSGKSILDAVTNLSKTLSKKLFFGQNKLIIFGRDAAESDFEKRLDYFLRSSDSRADVAVCISDTTAKDIIESKENNALVPCENILYLLKNGEGTGLSAYVDTNELLNLYTDKTSDIYLPVIERPDKKESVSVKGIGLFDGNNKMTYVTDDEETMGFLIISDKIKSGIIEVEDEKLGKIGVDITDIKVKKKAEISDGAPKFNVKVYSEVMINEIEKGVVTKLDEKELDKISRLVEKKINSICEKTFKACQENNSDSIRVGEYLAKDRPESYELLKDNWDYYFQTVKFSCNSDVSFKKISDNTQLE